MAASRSSPATRYCRRARGVANFALAHDPECEAQSVVSPAPHPDLLDVVVGQRVMAQEDVLVRGQVEQRRVLERAPDASSRHVPPLRYPFIPVARRCPEGNRPADGAACRPDLRQTGAKSVSYDLVRKQLRRRDPIRTLPSMTATPIGYARSPPEGRIRLPSARRFLELGVAEDRIYTDHGLTGANRARPGLDQTLASVREGDTLVVPKLDRLARSVPDARAIADQLRERGVKLAL